MSPEIYVYTNHCVFPPSVTVATASSLTEMLYSSVVSIMLTHQFFLQISNALKIEVMLKSSPELVQVVKMKYQ